MNKIIAWPKLPSPWISSSAPLRTKTCNDKLMKHNLLFSPSILPELIITAGGENVAPVPIEDGVKKHTPLISNCMLIGDARKFLSMIITLRVN